MFKIVYSFKENVVIDNFNLSILPRDVINHIEKITNIKQKQQTIHAWKLLSELVEETFNKNINEFSFKYNLNGKPEFDSFYVSISHSIDIVCVAISDYLIGIDVEKIRNLNNIETLKFKLLNNYNVNDEKFFEYFTKKEAKVKAFGLKLGMPRKDLDKNVEDVGLIKLKNNESLYFLTYYPYNNNIKIIEAEV